MLKSLFDTTNKNQREISFDIVNAILNDMREKYINAAVQALDSKELNDIEQYAVDPNTNWDEFWKEIAAKKAK